MQTVRNCQKATHSGKGSGTLHQHCCTQHPLYTEDPLLQKNCNQEVVGSSGISCIGLQQELQRQSKPKTAPEKWKSHGHEKLLQGRLGKRGTQETDGGEKHWHPRNETQTRWHHWHHYTGIVMHPEDTDCTFSKISSRYLHWIGIWVQAIFENWVSSFTDTDTSDSYLQWVVGGGGGHWGSVCPAHALRAPCALLL